MPRTSRQHSDTGVYHMMLRGIDRQDIFADDQDRGKLHQKNRPYFHFDILCALIDLVYIDILENNYVSFKSFVSEFPLFEDEECAAKTFAEVKENELMETNQSTD